MSVSTNSEEVDFQYRLSNAGVDRYLIPSVTVTHEEAGLHPPSAVYSG